MEFFQGAKSDIQIMPIVLGSSFCIPFCKICRNTESGSAHLVNESEAFIGRKAGCQVKNPKTEVIGFLPDDKFFMESDMHILTILMSDIRKKTLKRKL